MGKIQPSHECAIIATQSSEMQACVSRINANISSIIIFTKFRILLINVLPACLCQIKIQPWSSSLVWRDPPRLSNCFGCSFSWASIIPSCCYDSTFHPINYWPCHSDRTDGINLAPSLANTKTASNKLELGFAPKVTHSVLVSFSWEILQKKTSPLLMKNMEFLVHTLKLFSFGLLELLFDWPI